MEFLVTVPDNKYLYSLQVSGEDVTLNAENKFTVTIIVGLTISVEFKPLTISLALPAGVSLTDNTLDPDNLAIDSLIELLITPPAGE